MKAAWIVAVMCLVAGCEPPTPAEQKARDEQRAIDQRDGDEIDARVMAEKAVKACLKYPDDADFSWMSDARKVASPSGTGPMHWIVSGKVVAKNGFGAALTHAYEVQVYVANNTWTLYSASLDGQEIASGKDGFDATSAAVEKAEADKRAAKHKAEIAVEKEALKIAQEPLRWRTWQGIEGEAKFLRSGAGKATLETRDGSKLEVPLDSLSEDDRTWIKDWAKKKAIGK